MRSLGSTLKGLKIESTKLTNTSSSLTVTHLVVHTHTHSMKRPDREEDDDSGDDVNNDNIEENLETVQQQEKKSRTDCPYLDTINRAVLDFDFEKLCSVSLSNQNVYACLVCGKYYQGRGKQSHAYFHSLNLEHHVFINLRTHQVYALPDGYEVVHASLDDIKYVLNPSYTRADLAKLDKNTTPSRCLDGSEYLPGVVGLNNVKLNDALNAVVQALAHVQPLRDFYLLHTGGTPLSTAFSEVLRKLWNPRNFRAHVSPHELLQAIADASEKRFKIGTRADPVEFLPWLLNTLHQHTPRPPIIHQTFQGEVRVLTQTIREKVEEQSVTSPFLHLTLDLPVSPLYKDANEVNAIPHVSLASLLAKFDGHTWTDLPGNVLQRKQYVITRLPRYLVLHMRRFRRNNFFKEKNPTIVNFPLEGLDMSPYVSGPQRSTRYNLVASLRHEGELDKGQWSAYVQNRGDKRWFEVSDLLVTEVMPQLIPVSEAYLQIYEQQE